MDGWNNQIDTEAQLREFYREPSTVVQNKSIDHLDENCIAFIAQSTFVLIGTSDGIKHDVSPKGGPAGFVKVLDQHRLAIPDLNGNNRLDGLRDVLAVPQVGLLFIVPGMGETLRVNGDACVTVDDDVLDLFTDDVRRPKAALGVTVRSSFVHCAKAFMRGAMWEPSAWPNSRERPSAGEMLVAHAGITDITGAEIDQKLAVGYAQDLSDDSPD